MMLAGVFVLLHLGGHVSTTAPDVSCLIMNLDFVECSWNGQNIVNWTFYSRFHRDSYSECATYLPEEGRVVGCRQPYRKQQRFHTFHTKLTSEDLEHDMEHDLKGRVKMNPPSNLSVENSSGYELWLYWNNSKSSTCMESEVRHRTDSNEWKTFLFDNGKNSFSVPHPSRSHQYELQVRTRVSTFCGLSEFWSEWSQSVVWGPITVPGRNPVPTKALTAVLSVVATLVLLILVCLLVHNERLRVILIPIVPNPAKNPILAELLDLHNGNVEEWLHISKELKEGFKPNFSERACTVREYTCVAQSTDASESTASVTTDQSDCSVTISTDQSDCMSTSCSSSTSTLPVTSGEESVGPQ